MPSRACRTRLAALNRRMSSRMASTASSLLPNDLTLLLLDALDIVVVEHRLHRFDRSKKVCDRLYLFVPMQDPALDRGLICVVWYRVPCAEYELVRPGKGNEVSYQGVTFRQDRLPSRMVAIWLMEPTG